MGKMGLTVHWYMWYYIYMGNYLSSELKIFTSEAAGKAMETTNVINPFNQVNKVLQSNVPDKKGNVQIIATVL